MATLLWAVVAILIILWILSLVAHLGTILWLLLVAAVIVAIINFFTRGFANRRV